MSGDATPPAGPRCRQCTKPFGFAVAFCPFCGAGQLSAPTKLATPAQPVAPAPVSPPPPAVSPAPFSSFKRASWFPGQASVPPVPPAPKAAAPTPKVLVRPIPPKHRRLLTLAGLGVIAAAMLLRSGPMGTLVVYPAPGVPGIVTIDGEKAGPPGMRLQVPAGTHRLGFEADGWTTAGRQVTVGARERAVTIMLAPAPALVLFDVQTPGATLRLDDRPVDAAQAEVRIPPGRHRLTATRPGFAALSLELVLSRGERRSIPVVLSPLAVREVTRRATAGTWSEPVLLPPRTGFTMAAHGRLRLRIGQEVLLVQGGSINLGDVRGQSLQVKAVDDQPIDVHFYLRPEG